MQQTGSSTYPYSLITVVIIAVVLGALAFAYYPKWQKERTEATISWDVSGYYFYLPAIFIYKDLKQVNFSDQVMQTYYPASSAYQVFDHPSGNKVMKYSAGMAVMYLPAFIVGHLAAGARGDPQDGFSRAYQFAISLESLLIAILGVFLLRLLLIKYFSDKLSSLVLISVCLCTNYLEYASISGAMPHNYLFTIYVAVILMTISYYREPANWKGFLLGILCGLAVLTRPTEIIIALVPVLWGIRLSGWQDRLHFLTGNFRHVFLFLAGAIPVGLIQLIYWKYAAGEWIVYSYEEQGFSWLDPHFIKGLFNTRAGWFVYSPIMILSLIGFFALWKRKKEVFPAVLIVSLLAMYINFAWDEWMYGGSLGQRNLIQIYPLLAFPLGAFYGAMQKRKWTSFGLYLMIALCMYLMFWWVHQAHLGKYFVPGEVRTKYLAHVIGKWKFDRDYYKLLEKSDWYSGVPKAEKIVYENDFEGNLGEGCTTGGIQSDRAICVSREEPFSPALIVGVSSEMCPGWIRTSVMVHTPLKEWEVWKMTQMNVQFLKDGKTVKDQVIRLHRIMDHGETRVVTLDADVRGVDFDAMRIQFWNPGSDKMTVIDDLKVYCHE